METVPTIERVEYRQGLGILFKERSRAPAAVVLFFHGGGWFSGNAELVVPYLNQFSKTNFVCASAEYRVRARHGSTVYDSIKDAEDAAAFFRLRFPDAPFFLAGASSGGLLALLASRRVETLGVICLNPVLDLSAHGFSSRATPLGGDEALSPLHLVRSGERFPPILLVQGEKDSITPASTAREFAAAVASGGGSARLHCYPNKPHGFFKLGQDAASTAALVENFIADIVSRR